MRKEQMKWTNLDSINQCCYFTLLFQNLIAFILCITVKMGYSSWICCWCWIYLFIWGKKQTNNSKEEKHQN